MAEQGSKRNGKVSNVVYSDMWQEVMVSHAHPYPEGTQHVKDEDKFI